MGVGAFTLVRREVLESTRVLDRLRMEVADDIAIGALLKHAGARTRLLAGREQVEIAWLPNWRAMVRSFDKAGGALDFSLVKSLVAGLLPLGDLVAPVVLVALPGAGRWAGLVALALIWATHLIMARHFAAPLRGAWLWPVGVVLVCGLVLRAGLLAWWRQGIYWRGTFYSRGAVLGGRQLWGILLTLKGTAGSAD